MQIKRRNRAANANSIDCLTKPKLEVISVEIWSACRSVKSLKLPIIVINLMQSETNRSLVSLYSSQPKINGWFQCLRAAVTHFLSVSVSFAVSPSSRPFHIRHLIIFTFLLNFVFPAHSECFDASLFRAETKLEIEIPDASFVHHTTSESEKESFGRTKTSIHLTPVAEKQPTRRWFKKLALFRVKTVLHCVSSFNCGRIAALASDLRSFEN
jgi:hypothetical protein